MDNKTYTITLADGTTLSNLRLNGNNFISKTEISPDIFSGNCSPVTISDGKTSEMHDHMALVQVTVDGGEYWFVLRDIPKQELEWNKMQSDVSSNLTVAGVVFVKLAESGQIDDVTAGEHADLFSPWETMITYKVGDIRRYNGELYRCIQAHTSQEDWVPDKASSLWVKIADPAEEWPEWSQPIGAHDAYQTNDKVTHNGKHWISTVDGNVWEPGVYGWDAVD